MTKASPRIGLALGGGGARGLAHILVLEAFDELGLVPAAISGTSIGALIGAAYASGLSGADIHAYCQVLLSRRSAVIRHVRSRWSGRILDYWHPRAPSAFNSERIFEMILPRDMPYTFEDLRIPLETVAADFYGYCPYVSRSGLLLPAIAASAALPGLLTAVRLDGRVLIDGGFVNPLPVDILKDKADIIVAVDVSGTANIEKIDGAKRKLPGLIETVISSQQIALRALIDEKLKSARPSLLIRPQVGHFRVMDFLRKDEILAAAAPIKEEVKTGLAQVLMDHASY